MRNLMYNKTSFVNKFYRNIFWMETVMASLKYLTTICTLKQAPGGVLEYIGCLKNTDCKYL